jgi:hypothetical protein
MHLMIQTRSDLAYSVSRLAQFMSNSTDDHWIALKRILRYLNESKELRILYKKAPESLILKTWIDFSWVRIRTTVDQLTIIFYLWKSSSVENHLNRSQ